MRTSRFPVAPNRRTLGIGLLLLLLLALLRAWLVDPPPEQAPVVASATAGVPPTRGRPPGSRKPPPPPAPVADPPYHQVRAFAALAEALGYVWVDCPDVGLWLEPPNHESILTGLPGRTVFSSPAKTGSIPVRIAEERKDGTIDLGPVTRVLTWTTGPDGATVCRDVPPVVGSATVHVVDEDGAPVAVALSGWPMGPTGEPSAVDEEERELRASTRTFTVYNDGPVWVRVNPYFSPEWTAPEMAIRDGDDVVLVVTPTGETTLAEGQLRHGRARLADVTKRFAALEGLLGDPATDPSLRPALQQLAQWYQEGVDVGSAAVEEEEWRLDGSSP